MHPTYTPGALWPDTEGVHINAHGGGMLVVGETVYWFGEHKVAGKAGNKAMVGVSCYSSQDLVTWRNEGIVLPVVMDDPDHDLIQGCVIERPKVIHNPRTGQYVMWFHLELKGQGYAAARAGVAASDRPTGPYTYLGSRRPDEAMSRDMTLFVDDVDPWPDGTPKAYLFCASEDNATMHISLLTGDYLAPAGRFERIFIDRFMEAPAVFKHEDRYYFVGSGCTGWAPNAARSAVAPSVWGPWTELGNPCEGPNAELTFGAQSPMCCPCRPYLMPLSLWPTNGAPRTPSMGATFGFRSGSKRTANGPASLCRGGSNGVWMSFEAKVASQVTCNSIPRLRTLDL